MRILRSWLLVLTVVTPLFAQVNTASLGGLVTDLSHAVVPDATVTATSLNTGVVRTTRRQAPRLGIEGPVLAEMRPGVRPR